MTPPRKQPVADETTGEGIARLMNAFTRYGGWLGNNQHSIALRAHAQALERAVVAGTDVWPLINLLDGDLKRLPGGEIPKMLRRTLTEMSAVLESSAHGEGTGQS